MVCMVCMGAWVHVRERPGLQRNNRENFPAHGSVDGVLIEIAASGAAEGVVGGGTAWGWPSYTDMYV